MGAPRARVWIPLVVLRGGRLLPLFGIYAMQRTRIASLRADIRQTEVEMRRLQPQIDRIDQLTAEREQLNTRLSVIQGLSRDRYLAVKTMDHLADQVPDYLWLTRVAETGPDQLTVEGMAFSNLMIAELMSRMEESDLFDGIALVVAERAKQSPGECGPSSASPSRRGCAERRARDRSRGRRERSMALNPKDPGFQKVLLGGLVLAGLLYAFVFTELGAHHLQGERLGAGRPRGAVPGHQQEPEQGAPGHPSPSLPGEGVPAAAPQVGAEPGASSGESGPGLVPAHHQPPGRADRGRVHALPARCPPRPQQYYTENPIEITVAGGYHQVGAFLGEVANLDRIINVDNLEIHDEQGEEAERPAEASFVASTYTLGGTGVPPEEAKPAKEPKKSGKASGPKRETAPPASAQVFQPWRGK